MLLLSLLMNRILQLLYVIVIVKIYILYLERHCLKMFKQKRFTVAFYSNEKKNASPLNSNC